MRSDLFISIKTNIFILLLIFLFPCSIVFAKDDDALPRIGHFSLPVSQQPKSLISFGGNIFDKGTLQLTVVSSYFKGAGQYSTTVDPDLVYAITDKSSFLLDAPYAVRHKEGVNHSSGIEDIFLQFEHEVYVKSTKCYEEDITLVASFYAPTGNRNKIPATGAGAPSYFLGITYDRTLVEWFYFTSQGVLLPQTRHGNKNANVYIYQFGLGRNICYMKDKYIFDVILELTGEYTGRDRVIREVDLNSGGNIAYLTPSLWFSTKKWVFQFGVSYPIIQHVSGEQQKEHYGVLGSFSYTF